MALLAGQLENNTIIDVIRSIFLHGATGTLKIEHDGSTRRFHFVDGELHLPGTHALAQRLATLLESESRLEQESGSLQLSPEEDDDLEASGSLRRRQKHDAQIDPSARSEVLAELRNIVGRIVDVLVDWTEGDYVFDADAELQDDLIGPLPTAYLIMEGSVRGLSAEQMLRELGGEEAVVAADTESPLLGDLFGIDPGEMFVLSRAERAIRLSELLRQLPGTRTDALRILCRLKSVDLVVLPRQEEDEVETTTEIVLESIVDRFLERLERRLKTSPVPLDPQEHRRLVADLFAKFGSLNHYELLEVDFHADEHELHDRYDSLGRLVHPANAARLEMEGKEGLLRLLFERATVAYLTLSDPEKRAEYNQEAAIDASRLASPAERSEEQRTIARNHYQRAVELEGSEEYHFALELMGQAIQADPLPEYFALQGKIQSRNPRWLEKAVESYRHAIRRDPDKAEYRIALAKIMEQAGEPMRAKIHYRAALQKAPGTVEAVEALRRLQGSSASVGEHGFFNRLKRLWGR